MLADTSRVGGPYEFGQAPAGQGTRSDLEACRQSILQGESTETLWDEHFPTMVRYHRSMDVYRTVKQAKRNAPPNIIVLWGPTGTGKTTQAYTDYPTLFTVSPPKGSGLYYDGYDGELTLLFDDFAGHWMSYTHIKLLLDSRPYRLPVHGGAGQHLQANTIIFTSNRPPSLWYDETKIGPYADSPLARRLTDWGTITYMGGGIAEADYLASINAPAAPLQADNNGILWAGAPPPAPGYGAPAPWLPE